MGSGDLTSMTTAVSAEYCLGSKRLTISVVATVTNRISNAMRARARRMAGIAVGSL